MSTRKLRQKAENTQRSHKVEAAVVPQRIAVLKGVPTPINKRVFSRTIVRANRNAADNHSYVCLEIVPVGVVQGNRGWRVHAHAKKCFAQAELRSRCSGGRDVPLAGMCESPWKPAMNIEP